MTRREYKLRALGVFYELSSTPQLEAADALQNAANATAAVRENPWALRPTATEIGRLVHAGQLEHGAAWDALFIAATVAGLPHLAAQSVIGEAFAEAREAA